MVAFCALLCGNEPAVMTVSPAIATGVLVPAGSLPFQSILPFLVLSA